MNPLLVNSLDLQSLGRLVPVDRYISPFDDRHFVVLFCEPQLRKIKLIFSGANFFLLPQQVLTYIVVYTCTKIKSHKKSYKIFDFKSRDSTFYASYILLMQ